MGHLPSLHEPHFDAGVLPACGANVENFFSIFFEPHFSHACPPLRAFNSRKLVTWPHSPH